MSSNPLKEMQNKSVIINYLFVFIYTKSKHTNLFSGKKFGTLVGGDFSTDNRFSSLNHRFLDGLCNLRLLQLIATNCNHNFGSLKAIGHFRYRVKIKSSQIYK